MKNSGKDSMQMGYWWRGRWRCMRWNVDGDILGGGAVIFSALTAVMARQRKGSGGATWSINGGLDASTWSINRVGLSRLTKKMISFFRWKKKKTILNVSGIWFSGCLWMERSQSLLEIYVVQKWWKLKTHLCCKNGDGGRERFCWENVSE